MKGFGQGEVLTLPDLPWCSFVTLVSQLLTPF